MNASRTISARVGSENYSIVVGLDLDTELIDAVQSVGAATIALVSDSIVAPKWGKKVLATLSRTGVPAELFTFDRGEPNKNQETVSTLQNSLLEKRYGRDTLIVALGGGVVGDVAGYVASTFLRGVPYIQVPTTILAMVDSSIGGKVGIDTPYGKNTIGAFWQPKAVIADIRFLGSLEREFFVSGLLEAIKCFISADKEALKLVDELSLENPLSTPEQLQEIIVRAASFKASVVERDEREENERRVLNFGHTIGHALELLSGYSMPHGYAVGHGILVETRISELLGILPASERAAINAYLARFGVTPAGLKQFDAGKVIEATKGDKKVKGGAVYYVLLESIGKVYQKNGEFAHPVEDTVVLKALESL